MKKKLLRTYTFAILFAVMTSCATLPPADPKLSATLHEIAIRETTKLNYASAIEKYAEAISYNPQNSVLYQQRAEVLEMLQQFAEAAKTYELALDRLPSDHLDREEIHYRLGLVQARDKANHRKANRNLEQVTDASMHSDLEGFIALHAGNPDQALFLFSQALETASDFEHQARIYYHASLAHFAKKDNIESKNALFHAVNNARSLALKQHIRIFFDQIR